LLLIGFAGAFRRSELVGLNVDDVADGPDGLTVLLRCSKTNQEGAGHKVRLPYGSNPATCQVQAYRAWLAASGITDGAIFRPVDRHGRMAPGRLSGKAVALVVKRSAAATGLDPAVRRPLPPGWPGHLSRPSRGERPRHHANDRSQSPAMVGRYVRDVNQFRPNAAAAVGL
jgi:hypothetical protein